jgi:hypothetical protein
MAPHPFEDMGEIAEHTSNRLPIVHLILLNLIVTLIIK